MDMWQTILELWYSGLNWMDSFDGFTNFACVVSGLCFFGLLYGLGYQHGKRASDRQWQKNLDIIFDIMQDEQTKNVFKLHAIWGLLYEQNPKYDVSYRPKKKGDTNG